jgi:hypothetical protein
MSTKESEVVKIPADPKAVVAAYESERCLFDVNSELSGLYQKIGICRVQLEEDDRIIKMLREKRDLLAAEIASMEQRAAELKEKKKRL